MQSFDLWSWHMSKPKFTQEGWRQWHWGTSEISTQSVKPLTDLSSRCHCCQRLISSRNATKTQIWLFILWTFQSWIHRESNPLYVQSWDNSIKQFIPVCAEKTCHSTAKKKSYFLDYKHISTSPHLHIRHFLFSFPTHHVWPMHRWSKSCVKHPLLC